MASAQSYLPFPNDGWSTDDRATATCFCAAVQLSFPTSYDNGLVESFLCNCTDCRKITASTYASNFIVKDSTLTYERGQDKLTKFAQSQTIASGNSMENSFCSICGTLMYRRSTGYKGVTVMRIGTVDDFTLHETKLKPRFEQFVKSRVGWCQGGEGIKQIEGDGFKK